LCYIDFDERIIGYRILYYPFARCYGRNLLRERQKERHRELKCGKVPRGEKPGEFTVACTVAFTA
jgi:hypothetical protein